MIDFSESFTKAQNKVALLKKNLQLADKKTKLAQLKQEAIQSDFWDNTRHAQQVMQELDHLQTDIDILESLDQVISENLEALDLYDDQLSKQDQQMMGSELKKVQHKIKQLELQTYFSQKYDKAAAILSIHAGQGGTEACDWAAMLQRMYIKYFENKEYKSNLIDIRPAEEAGIKSVTYIVKGRYAYGHLKHEGGVHRLVRLSPFNSDNLRQTSFAGVEVLPLVDEDDDQAQLNPDEVEFEAFRSSGKGGQNVNKVSTAVRLKHIPTGIVVECQTQRTQVQNRKIATQILQAKLWEREEEKRQKELSRIKGDHQTHGWGNQIRSYVLHPYKLVKDLRTKHESSDPDAVLSGDLESFVQAAIRMPSHNSSI